MESGALKRELLPNCHSLQPAKPARRKIIILTKEFSHRDLSPALKKKKEDPSLP